MQAQSSRPVRTFTIAMPEAGLDESEEARAVAAHLGTDHTEVELSVGETQALIPSLSSVYDEPFADMSQLPTSLVCAVARRHVVVSLSGDGGDEVFGGYNRYLYGRLAWRRTAWLPRSVRAALARALLAPAPATWDSLVERLTPLLPRRMRVSGAGDKARKLAGVLGAGDQGALYLALVSQWDEPEVLLMQGREPPSLVTTSARWPALADVTEAMMYLDTAVSLPDDMLTKVDRASMAVGLEARVPLLDHRVVEFAWRLPPHLRVGRRHGKHLLRKVLFRHVPPSLIERPKAGFDPPVGAWLRGPLRNWAESLLDQRVLAADGYLDPRPIRRCWAEHLDGTRNWDYRLWSVLMFQAWRQT
ncbi:MAG: asparagine synthase C-terminal domain-containing protein, partial [Actinobacteria bacterium]|nr:asparagine synthase C-terminal domain-containing protein [Actinomycetota bacterium]